MIKFLLVLVASISVCACHRMPMEYVNDCLGVKDDNIMEETIEFLIEKYSTIDVDTTPRSDED